MISRYCHFYRSPLLQRFWSYLPYSALPSTDTTKASTSPQLRPKVLDILMLKRGRMIGALTLAFILLFLVISVPNTISRTARDGQLSSWRHGTHLPETERLCTTVDWSRFAYVQYVTNVNYLCNSVMLFEILSRLKCKADRVMMYPSAFSVTEEPNGTIARLLVKARDEYQVKLQPIEIQRGAGSEITWAESYTKLLAINQTQYDRVLILDSDSTVLQTMDELFLIPSCPVAMPRAYWLGQPNLSSQLALIQPSEMEYKRVVEAIEKSTANEYDMEIFNKLYGQSGFVIPHRPYNLLTGEFRSTNHEKYMGNNEEVWDPEVQLKEAKFLHFSDYPVPKPWLRQNSRIVNEHQPKCEQDSVTGNATDCRAQVLWHGFYSDFAERRKAVCDLDV